MVFKNNSKNPLKWGGLGVGINNKLSWLRGESPGIHAGDEPGSVKEVDHDFVEAVEQVRKEIPGFTF